MHFEILKDLIEKDNILRNQLIEKKQLFLGYNPEMEALQLSNGKKLEELISQYGWPLSTHIEKEIIDAAWLIGMHAISLPSLQKKMLSLFKNDHTLCLPFQSAMLEDRVLVSSGKKQKFGTQLDWDENGLLNPFPIDKPETVDERRKQVGLDPLEMTIERLRRRANAEGEKPPQDLGEHTELRESWMLRVGWISNLSEIETAYDKYR